VSERPDRADPDFQRGKLAFLAFRMAHDGGVFRAFSDLPKKQRDAWIAAAKAVLANQVPNEERIHPLLR